MPLYVERLPSGDVVAFGEAAAVELLDGVRDTVPEALVRQARSALASTEALGAMAEQATGAVLRLTPESQRLLAQYEPLQTSGGMLGVLRGADGKINHQLVFETPAASMVAGLPAIVSAVALQQQLAAIERKLEAIGAGIDYLTELEHIEVEAELLAAIGILGRVFDATTRTGELSDDDWHSVSNVELAVKTLHGRTSAHLRDLEDLFDDEDPSLGQRVKQLSSTVSDRHIGAWLHFHVQADRALTQWESLHLIRRIDKGSADVDRIVAQTRDGIVTRHRHMAALAEGFAAYLADAGQVHRWLDRIRLLSRARLTSLLTEFDGVFQAYQSAVVDLGIELEAAPATPELPTPDDSSWSSLVSRVQSSPARAIRATAAGTGALVDRVGQIVRRSDD